MGVVSINYDGGDYHDDNDNLIKCPIEYESVEISYNGLKDTKIFNSGDFVQDWFDCNKFIMFELADKEFHFSNSSSVDHFIMDGAPYISTYLKKGKDEKWYLDYEYDFQNEGFEFFVKKGTKPTWEELKEKYNK